MKKPASQGAAPASTLEPLEPRLLFSADPLTGLLADTLLPATPLAASIPDAAADPLFAASVADTSTVRELVLISAQSGDIDALVNGLAASDHLRHYYQLSGTADGVEQINNILQRYQALSSIHIVGHGGDGQLVLGSSIIDTDWLASNGRELLVWRESVSDTADLLLYGCDVAADDSQFISELAQLTGMDVAASDDLTGTVAGADWALERQVGNIETNVLFDDATTALSDALTIINVTTFDDVYDIDEGDIDFAHDVLSNPGPDGKISLREAVFAADAADGADIIVLQAGTYRLTNSDTYGELITTNPVEIRGQGQGQTIIDGELKDRILKVNGTTATLQDLALTRGSAPSGAHGGALDVHGAALTLVRVVVGQSSTTGAVGGAVHVAGDASLAVEDSVFVSNATPDEGGAIYADGDITIKRSIFSANSGSNGGAIASKGTVLLEDTHFLNNTANDDGGGLHKGNGSTATLLRVTFESNSAAGYGGGLWADGDTQIHYVTFSGNEADIDGGGIFTKSNRVEVYNSTFFQNVAVQNGAAIATTNAPDIKGTAFAANTFSGTNVIDGSVISLGFNLWQDAAFADAVSSDLGGLDAKLGALQDNGGYVPTHLPQADSPLRDAGYGRPGTDATGSVQNAIPDIGAVEARATSIIEKLYWVDRADQTINRMNTDGTAAQTLLLTSTLDATDIPFDIEVDAASGYLYWVGADNHYDTNRQLGSVMRADLDGSNPSALVSGIKFPSGIAINTADNEMYVSSDSSLENDGGPPYNNRIFKYDLDGQNESVVLTGTTSQTEPNHTIAPTDVEWDPVTNKLYWSDRSQLPLTYPADVTSMDFDTGVKDRFLVNSVLSGQRAYGITIVEGTGKSWTATGSTLDFVDTDSGTESEVAIPAGTHGVQYAAQSDKVFVTTLDGGISRYNSSSVLESVIRTGLSEPGAIAVAYLDPVNETPALEHNLGVTVNEATGLALTRAMLEVTDSDTADADLTFTVDTAPAAGQLQNSGGSVISDFTMADIDAGEVVYSHLGDAGTLDEFYFTVSDGFNSLPLDTFSITIIEADDIPVAVDNSYDVDEGGSRILAILANDSDEETSLDPATLTITAGVSNGTLTPLANGTVNYAHNGSETTTDLFRYTVEDATGNTSNVAIVNLSINPLNDAPVATDDAGGLSEGGTLSLGVSGNDTDADDGLDLSSIVVTGGPSSGTAAPVGAGNINYFHDGSETTADSFSYTIADLTGAISNAATVSLSINAVNDKPVAAADSAAVLEGQAVSINVLGNDMDAEGLLDAGSVAIDSAANFGALSVDTAGNISYTHNGSENYLDSFQYSVADTAGLRSDPVTVTVTIGNVNDAPVAGDDSGSLSEGGTVTLNVMANDADAENGLDPTSVTIIGTTSRGVAIANADGTITYTHDGSETLSDIVMYQIADIDGDSSNTATVSLSISPVNDKPVALADSATVSEAQTVSINVLGNDTDAEGFLDAGSVAIDSAANFGALSVDAAGNISYTHNGSENFTDSFQYSVADTSGLRSDSITVTVSISNVNDVPVALDDAGVVDEADAITLAVLANDSDAENGIDLSTVTIIGNAARGTAVVNTDGTITYTHDGSETLSDSYTYKVADTDGDSSNTATVSLTINPLNDPPVTVADAYNTDEGSSTLLNVLGNDTDVDDTIDSATVLIVIPATRGTTLVNPDGTITYTHDGSESLSDSFAYSVRDSAGDTSAPTPVTLSINPVNDAPIAVTESFLLNEGSSLSLQVTGNDVDADDGLDMSSIIITAPPVAGVATPDGSGRVMYTHNGSENFSDTFSYTIADTLGAVSNAAQVNIGITPVNDQPQAQADSMALLEGNLAVIQALLNDSDAENDLDAASVVIDTPPLYGSATVYTMQTLIPWNNGSTRLIEAGEIVYSHNGSENYSDTFSYRVSDGAGYQSVAAPVTLTITNLNDAPIAVADTAGLAENGFLTLDVLSNDTDAEGGIDPGTVTLVNAPVNGTSTVNPDGSISYQHNGSETLDDSLSYRFHDIDGASSNIAAVTIAVAPVNDAPQAVDDTGVVAEGGTAHFDVVANDSDADDGIDPGSVSIVTAPLHGSIVTQANGSITYLHDGSETTLDSLEYTVADTTGASSDLTTLVINIAPVNDAPVALAESGTVLESGSLTLDLAANDVDAEMRLDADSIVVADFPASTLLHGRVSVLSGGVVTYHHDGSESLVDHFYYTISDLDGGVSDTVRVDVTITPINDVPQANADSITVLEGGTVTLDARINDMDPDNDVASAMVTLTSGAVNGVATVNGDGTFTYVHNGGESSNDSFGYTLTDSVGGVSAPAAVSVDVIAVNDVPVVTPDAVTVPEGGFVGINVLANDADAEGALDPSSLDITAMPAHGSLSLNADGMVLYQHDGSETLADAFDYRVADTSGVYGGAVRVQIAVDAVNDLPIAAADSATLAEAGTVDIDVLQNDSDAEDTLSAGNIAFAIMPDHGVVSINSGGQITYQHDGGETTGDSFSYYLADSGGERSEPAVVTLWVTPVDDAPVAVDDRVDVVEGDVITVAVKQNDMDPDTPLQDLTVEVLADPEHGSIVLPGDGSIVYSHGGGEASIDKLSYRLIDANGVVSAPAELFFNVIAINDVPELAVAPTVELLAPFTLALPETLATDADDQHLTVTAQLPDGSPLPEGITFNAETGVLDASGIAPSLLPEQINIVIADGNGASTSLMIFMWAEPELAGAHGALDTRVPDLQLTPVVVASALQTVSAAIDTDTVADTVIEIEAAGSGESDAERINVVLQPDIDASNSTTLALFVDAVRQPSSAFFHESFDAATAEQTDDTPLVSLLPADFQDFTMLFGALDIEPEDILVHLYDTLNDHQGRRQDNEAMVLKVLAGSTMATSAVSVGYVLWLIRGGVLISSVLTALPAWRFVDPFPVLSHLDGVDADEGADEDAETLQSMVEGAPTARESRAAD